MRKALISLLLAAVLLCSGVTASAVTVQELPEAPERFADVVSKDNPLRTVFSGAYKVPVKVDEETERSAIVYLGKDYQQTQGFVMIVPDSKMTAEKCLEDGGWKALADKKGLMLMVLEPDGKPDLNPEGKDFAYMKAAAAAAGSRTHWMQLKGRLYMAAYGDGADLAMKYVQANVNSWAGLVTFGDLTVQPKDLDNSKGVELPVWMFVNTLDKEKALVDQFKLYNGCTNEVFSSQSATQIYMPNQKTNDLLLNDQPMSQVRVTVARDAAELRTDRAELVYDFLRLGTREVAYGNVMRYSRDLSDWGAEVKTVQIDDITRSYVQYVPTSLRETAAGKAPLMLALHGNALNGEYFVERTNFIRLAEEYGFIIVFPTGSISTGVSPTWNLTRSEKEWDDVAFIKAMVDKVCKEQPVDTSRVYCYGHSMGGMTTQMLVTAMDGTFAAAAGTGCASTNVPKADSHKYDTPIFVIMGENDLFGTTYKDENSQYFIDYFTSYNKTAKEPTSYRSGRFEHYTFENKAGVPMVRFTIAEDMPHTATLDEGMLIFDYLSQFSRGADGSVVYQGGVYNAK